MAKALDKEFWALVSAQLWSCCKTWAPHFTFLYLHFPPLPKTHTSGSVISLENTSRHRLFVMRLCNGQVSMIAGLDVGFRYACNNINDNDVKSICAKVIF